MAPLVIQAILLVAAIICFFCEWMRAQTTRPLIALGLLFFAAAMLVPPINGIVTR